MKIVVHGIPAPQGSKRHVGNGVMIESSAKVKPWREAVKWAAIEALRTYSPFGPGVPVAATMTFYLPRPKGHYGTGKNASNLKPSAPMFVTTKPDKDKLIRSTFDALGDAGVWVDDAQVVVGTYWKRYADNGAAPGADIDLRVAGDVPW